MNRTMTVVIAGALLAAATAPAGADDVLVRGLPPYDAVRVTGVRDCEVVFRTASGSEIVKPMKDVEGLLIVGQSDFNQAEELLRQRKPADAVAAFDAAARKAQGPWMDKLVQMRRLAAIDRAGLMDRATEEWLLIVEANHASEKSLSLRPQGAGPRGSADNAKAIALLEKTLQRLPDGAGKYAAAVRELLMKLYAAEGRQEQATAMAQALAASGVAVPRGPDQPGSGPAAPPPPQTAQLDAAAFLIEQGKAGDAVPQLQAKLRSYAERDLPRALLLLGKAQVRMAQKAAAAAARALLEQGGLNCMRVAVFFPDAPQAAEALYLAGSANALLGNSAAAQKAFRRVIEQYGSSEFARAAQADLDGPAGK